MALWTTGELVTAARLTTYTGTKEVFFPFLSQFNGTDTIAIWGIGGATLVTANDYARLIFLVPYDFGAIVETKIIVIPAATTAHANWDITATYASVGQAYNTHAVSDTATLYNVTDSQLYGVDAATILASIVAGDSGYITFLLADSNDDVIVRGLYLKYTVA